MKDDIRLTNELVKLSHLTEDKEHLSDMLFEAASRITDLRGEVRSLSRAAEDTYGWIWSDDEDNHLESMSNGKKVIMTASQLRHLIGADGIMSKPKLTTHELRLFAGVDGPVGESTPQPTEDDYDSAMDNGESDGYERAMKGI